MVDQLRQALIGMDGGGGALDEIKMLRQRSHDLANAIQKLNGSVDMLTEEMRQIRSRQPGEERREVLVEGGVDDTRGDESEAGATRVHEHRAVGGVGRR